MGQTRKDTGPQRAAKARRAERTRCPRCNTAGALLSRVDKVDGALTGVAVECRRRAKGCTYASYTDYTTEPPTRTEATPPAEAADARRWWVVSGDGMVNHYYADPAGRSAVARFRADLVESFRAGDFTQKDAVLKVRALSLCVLRGPLTTAQACADETGWTWAEAICDEAHAHALAPLRPATREEAAAKLGEPRTARLEAQVRARYGPPRPRSTDPTTPNTDA